MFRIIPDAKNFKEHVLLKDGQGVLLRPANEGDKQLVRSFFKNVSAESLRLRFMASVSQIPESTINMFCSSDFQNNGCLLAISGENHNEEIVGLGNYAAMPNGRSAEVAFLIADKYQGKGIATTILERLAGIAAGQGFVEFEAEVLPENTAMIGVFKSSGFGIHQSWSSDTVHLEFPVDASMWLWERAGLRERIAVANSIKPLLAPKSIAVIGASRDDKSIGNKIFRNLISGNFKGTVYPVNQEADSIMGVKAYSKISELPTDIDLAVVSVPANNVNEVIERAIHKGARGIVVVSAGFAEAGEEGIKRQEELVKIIRKHGVRLVGPSCLGVINTSPTVSMNSSLSPSMPPFGKAGFFSHSAALGIVVLNYAKERGIGFTTFVSAGNRADVSGNDLLQYWEEDNQTKFAILYLETFGNPRRFVRIARRMSYKKPILCVKSGRSYAGALTTKTKYTSSITSYDEVDALFSQTGMIVTDTLEELFDVAAILSSQPLPKGNGVGIIGNSAGMVTLFADAAETNNLVTTEDNLLNLGAFATSNDYREAVSNLYSKETVNSLLIGFAGFGQIEPEEIIRAITEAIKNAVKQGIHEKPVALCMMGKSQTIVFDEEEKSFSFPTFRFPETAARALGKVAKYSKFVELGAGKLVWFEDVNVKGAREFVTKLLRQSEGEEILRLKDEDTNSLLQFFGFDNHPTDKGPSYRLLISPDPLFGPTIKILPENKKTIVRITPLTDKDILEILSELELQSDNKLGNLIGKLSQMIEEIPWLWSLSMVVNGTEDYSVSNVEIELKTKGSNLPQY